MISLRNIMIALFLTLFAYGITQAQLVVIKKPVKPHVVAVKVAQPGPNMIWIDGHWRVKNNKYIWSNGYWTKARPNMIRTSGHWRKVPGGWKWSPGHWKKVHRIKKRRI